MFVVGLTGGIGVGKSHVARHFAELGVPVIDADEVARDCVALGSDGLRQVAAAFGQGVILPSGELDRGALRTLVFANEPQRKRLEAILHPRIRVTIEARLATLDTAYVILMAPLLIEAEMTDLVDRILVVDCDEQTRVARLCTRDQVTPEQVQAIMAAQVPRSVRLARADDIIDNGPGGHDLAKQVLALHQGYLTHAAK